MLCSQKNRMISRIKAMEQLLDEVQSALREADSALDRLEGAKDAVRQLIEYYYGQDWREDLEADESGLLPRNLKRGVLSEDGIWNTLAHYREMLQRMAELSKE